MECTLHRGKARMPVLGGRPDQEAIAAKLAGVPRPWYVDVGSGADPIPFANILVEKFLGETNHRSGQFATEGKVVLQGDLGALPFLDHSVDFIWCSHVLEHLEDPEVGMNELQRVARKGLAFVPTPWSEAVYQEHAPGHAVTHRWLCWSTGDDAVFFKCDTRDKPLTRRALTAVGAWPAPNVARNARTETRIGWGWGSWPARIRVVKWEFDLTKEEEIREWLDTKEQKSPKLD